MGNFVAVTAARDADPARLVDEIITWFESHFVVCHQVESDDVRHDLRVQVFVPRNGWTPVMWPTYFLGYDVMVAEHIARALGTAVETASVYDSESWQHVLFDGDRIVDRYTTDPASLASELVPVHEIAGRWRGDPDALARFFGIRSKDVERLYRRQRRERTFDDWGFVELWELMGLTYPVGVLQVAANLALPDRFERLPPIAASG